MSVQAPAYPIRRELRVFLARLQRANARGLAKSGVPIEAAARNATELVDALERDLRSGDLIDMEPNVVLREMRAGVVPEEFRP